MNKTNKQKKAVQNIRNKKKLNPKEAKQAQMCSLVSPTNKEENVTFLYNHRRWKKAKLMSSDSF